MHYRGNGLPERKPEYRLGVIGICIALFACVFAAWGQDGDNAHDGNDIVHAHYYTDFDFEVDKDEDKYERVYSWHEHKIRDGTYEAQSHHGAGERNIKTQNGYGHDGEVDEPETPTPPRRTRRLRSTSTTTEAVEDTLDEVVESSDTDFLPGPEPLREDRMLPLDPEPEPEPIILEQHEYQLFVGYTLIGFPVRLVEDREIQEFYGNNDFFDSPTEGIFVHVPVEGLEQEWYFYNGEGVWGNLRIPLWSHFGMIVKLDEAETMELEGVPLEGKPTVPIREGWNLIGLPEAPAAYERPSDFLSDDISVVLITDETGFQLICRVGDPGDNLLYPGQALLLQSVTELTLDLSLSVVAAPSVRRKGTLATSWGAMKR